MLYELVLRFGSQAATLLGGDWHRAGQWVFNNPSQYFVMDQWKRNGNFPINQGMIGFVSIGGDVRILAAHNSLPGGDDTGGQPHPTFSPDGKLVMWTSNMNGSARFDVFVARGPRAVTRAVTWWRPESRFDSGRYATLIRGNAATL